MYNITAQMKEKPARDFVYDTVMTPISRSLDL